MFFDADEDDDGGGFSSGLGSFKSGGSSLSSLFGAEKSSIGNESLKYSAPKQPKPKAADDVLSDPNEQKPDSPSLLFACAVHAFKLSNGEYVKQGKVGAAILGSLSSKDYKILLYITQKKPVTSATINATFTFNLQKGNYATFYDDQSQNWSICFEADSQLLDFAKWIGLARYNVSENKLITQDLNFLEDQEIRKGDTVEIVYTGWLHAGNSFGKIFDSNKDSGKYFVFKVGKGKVIKGWEQGVIGMKKLSKRLLVVPPDLGYGLQGVGEQVPKNATLIFQVEVTRVKFATTSIEVTAVSDLSVNNENKSEPVIILNSNLLGSYEEGSSEADSFRDRAKSINDHINKLKDESTGSTKSKLLERMSKMGHSMMPSVIQKNDTKEHEVNTEVAIETHPTSPVTIQPPVKSEFPKPALRAKPEQGNQADHTKQSCDSFEKPPVYLPQNVDYNLMPNNSTIQPQYLTSNYQPASQNIHQVYHPHQLSVYQSPQVTQSGMFGPPQYPTVQPITPSLSSTEMNLVMTDGRLKHSEIKNDLTRIMDKLDLISQKVISLDNSGKHAQAYQSQAPEMEANVLLHNITRIVKENEKLRSDVEEKNRKIESLNERMSDLLTKNQQFLERSNTLIANQSDSLYSTSAQASAKVVALEELNAKLEAELSATKKQFFQVKSKQDFSEQQEAELNAELQSLKRQLKIFKETQDKTASSTGEQETIIDELNKKLVAEKKESKQLQNKLVQLEEEHTEMLQEKNELGKNVVDLKKKMKDAQRKWEEETEILKSSHEEELQSLKQNFRKSSGVDKLVALENELKLKYENEVAEKLTKLNEKHNSDIMNLQKEKEDALKQLKEQLATERFEFQHSKDSLISMHKLQVDNLEIKNAELLNQLQETKASMKTLSEDLLKETNEKNRSIEKLQSELVESYEKGVAAGRSTVKVISASSYDRGFSEGKASVENLSNSKEALLEKIKKIMSGVFFQIKSNFVNDQKYSGEHVIGVVLENIKKVTLQMNEENPSSNEDDSSEEEEEEEEREIPSEDNNQNNSDLSTKTLSKPEEINAPLDADINNVTKDSSKNSSTSYIDKVETSQTSQTPQLSQTSQTSQLLKLPSRKEEIENEKYQITHNKLTQSLTNTLEKQSLEVTKNVEVQKPSGQSESLFGDSNDDTMFVNKNIKAAHSRSPPPLFGDDDDDTNWI
ncbi:FK506-binding protein 15 isoform X1 [Hydra vulgaris]|uniref:FK506-binding protein 15 isoform X1 n=1 Tax=Hydra vulgaris TaxID=6087 RepID=UPI001F5E3828|nr:FK506-binding protein 15 isoform X1 [Hydra vulgaris]